MILLINSNAVYSLSLIVSLLTFLTSPPPSNPQIKQNHFLFYLSLPSFFFYTAVMKAGEMAAALQFPFTTAQWKELERQAMIYKYMMASIPVPPQLLFPLTTNFSAEFTTTSSSGWGDLYGWRYTSSAANSKDAEPGRCKRTDGKKWRCSRDVAPNQKYCERHMHRGRPRSRKHVEVQSLVSEKNNSTNKKTRLNNATLKTTPVEEPNHQQLLQSNRTSHVVPKMNTDLSIKTFANRDINWVMKDKVMGIEGVEQQWPNFMTPKIDNHPSLFQQQFEGEGLNLFSFTDSTAVRDVNLTNVESQFFLNSDKQSKGEFIDAWSNDALIRTTNSTNNGSSRSSPRGSISPSLTLSMAMAAGNILDEDMEKIQEGGCDYIDKDTNFLSTHSWNSFASGGGPLAEVLHTGGVAATSSNPASPYAGNGDSDSPLSTNISSPSGVQHRALFTQSDNTICNVAFPPVAPTEVAPFKFLN